MWLAEYNLNDDLHITGASGTTINRLKNFQSSVDDNCDGLIDEGLSINTLDANSITIFPNPANTEIHLAHNLHILAIITHNSLGEEIPIQFKNDVADISTIPPGIYFSEITAEEGRMIVRWVKK